MVCLSLETEALSDILAQILRIREALRPRRDPRASALAHRIDSLTKAAGAPSLTHIGDGAFVAAPPAEWTAVLVEARRLKV